MTHRRIAPPRARTLIIAVAACAAAVFAACDGAARVTEPEPPELAPAFAHTGDHLNAMVDRAWGDGIQWEFVRPRPPGIGSGADGSTAPGLLAARVRLYQIAPVNTGDPLSPEIDLSHLGLIHIGGRDHVLAVPQRNRGSFTGIGQTVPVLHPGWQPMPPFGDAQCNNFVGPDVEARVAWQRVVPTPHPCGWAAVVYAAQLDADACVQPLTTVARVEAAAAQGLVQLAFPPEPAWPFAIRPLTQAGAGRVEVASPACVPAGERVVEAA
jgi:hypothetical protein